MNDPLSLLIVNPMGGEGWGGVERWFAILARGLRERGHQVRVAGRAKSKWMRVMREEGFEGLDIPLRADFHLGQARKLSQFMTTHAVDVVATKLHRGIRTSGFAARFGGGPPVVAFMGLVETKPGLRYRLTYDLFLDRIVTLSGRMRDAIIETASLEPGMVDVIPYGIVPEDYERDDGVGLAVRAELGVPADAPVALALGRLNDQKRFDRLLETWHLLRSRLPEARLLIAGTGSLQDDLDAQVERLQLGDRVQLIGFRTDIAELLSACDCLVLSSDDEGLPMVVLEAMGASRPTVTTPVGSVDSQVVDGETGRIVPKEPAALADALFDVLGRPDRGRALGRAANARVREHFPLDLCVERTEAYFRSIARRDGAPARDGGRDRPTTSSD